MLEVIFWFLVAVFFVSVGWAVYRLFKREVVWGPLIMLNLANLGIQICNLINLNK